MENEMDILTAQCGLNRSEHIRRARSILLLGVVLLVLAGTPTFAAEPLQRFEYLQIRMGIPVRITLYAPSQTEANRASSAAYDRFRELDRTLSDYDPDSELMQLCAQPAGLPVPVGADLLYVLQKSQQLSQFTGGAFDVSVGPVVKLWRIARRRRELPTNDKLAAARSRIGYEHIEVDAKVGTVTLHQPGMQLDLGAIAKGYAADEACKVMAELGMTRVLIDAGGDLVVGDPPPDHSFWSIAIEPLRLGQQTELPVFLELKNCSVATSGDAYQHVEIGGQRYSHIVDPKTGLGLTRPSSVTVIAPNGTAADGLASAISVLGPDDGLKLLDRYPGCSALVVELVDDRPVTHQSEGFERYIRAADDSSSTVDASESH